MESRSQVKKVRWSSSSSGSATGEKRRRKNQFSARKGRQERMINPDINIIIIVVFMRRWSWSLALERRERKKIIAVMSQREEKKKVSKNTWNKYQSEEKRNDRQNDHNLVKLSESLTQASRVVIMRVNETGKKRFNWLRRGSPMTA